MGLLEHSTKVVTRLWMEEEHIYIYLQCTSNFQWATFDSSPHFIMTLYKMTHKITILIPIKVHILLVLLCR